MVNEQPNSQSVDRGLQAERTSLAWERTAIAMMVAGVVFARYAATDAHPGMAVLGLIQTGAGGAFLLWAAWHTDELHGPIKLTTGVVHPNATRIVGLATVVFTTVTLVFAAIAIVANDLQ